MPDRILRRDSGHEGEGLVDNLHPLVGGQDHHAIDAVLDDHRQTAALGRQLLVEAGVADCDRGLIGEPLQELPVQRGEGGVAAEQIDNAEQVFFKEEREADHLRGAKFRPSADSTSRTRRSISCW